MRSDRVGSIASVAQARAYAHDCVVRVDLMSASHFIRIEIVAQLVHRHHMIIRHAVGHVEHLREVEMNARVGGDTISYAEQWQRVAAVVAIEIL